MSLLAAAAALTAASPAAAAWTAPATVSTPHTFASGLEAAPSLDGTVVADWGFQDGIGNDAGRGVRGTSLAPGAAAFGPERVLPRDLLQAVPYGQRSVAAVLLADAVAGARDRLSIAFGSASGPSLGSARTVVTEDVAFLPNLAVASNGSGVVAWIARASGNRRIVRVALKGAGHGFGRAGRLLARYRRHGRDWGPVEDLGAVAAGTDNRLAALVTSGGRATVVDVHRQLSEGGDAGPLLVDAWVQPVGGRFRAAQRLEQADGVAASAPALVPGDARGAIVAWVGGDPGAPPTPDGPSTRVRVSVQGSDGRFGTPQALSAPAQPVKAVAAASNGTTTIVSWVRIDPQSDGDGQVLATLRPAFGTFGAAEEASPHENASETAPGFGGTGPGTRPFVVWSSRPEGEGPGVPIARIRTFVRVSQRVP